MMFLNILERQVQKMEFKKGFCRIETTEFLRFGEIIEIKSDYVVFRKYKPISQDEKIKISDIVAYEQVKEEEIPPYE